jgi:hypothetical protein
MDDNNGTFDALEKAINENDELKGALLELQRKATVEGWTTDEHAERAKELLQQNDIALSPEALLSVIKDSGYELTDSELDQVSTAASWGKNCNKRKECPGSTGRSCYPHC